MPDRMDWTTSCDVANCEGKIDVEISFADGIAELVKIESCPICNEPVIPELVIYEFNTYHNEIKHDY